MARLTEHIKRRVERAITQNDLRAQSAGMVSPSDVEEVDHALIAFVGENRASLNILIDSHPVTKEAYGYRITPFSLERFGQLAPDEIWVLFASPSETRRRIADDDGGRPMVSEEEARTHTALQASVAATYGMSLGRPVYLFDTAAPRDELLARLAERLA
jgi:adenylate kinase